MSDNMHENSAEKKISLFDQTFCSDHIRMLKIILHYIPESYRKNLTVYIKFMELQQVLHSPCRLPRCGESDCRACDSAENNTSPSSSCDAAEPCDTDSPFAGLSAMIHELLPYCSLRERQQITGIENMLNTFDQMKSMMEMAEMFKDMKDMFGSADGSEGGLNPEMLAGMMGMDGFDFSKFTPFS